MWSRTNGNTVERGTRDSGGHVRPSSALSSSRVRRDSVVSQCSAAEKESWRARGSAECVNQERNQYVAQMRSIYSAAKETTIFLDEGTSGSDALLSAIQDAIPHISVATTKGAVVKSLVYASGMRKHGLIGEAFNILWRPYWTRIWIFQEIVVSNNPMVQCGS